MKFIGFLLLLFLPIQVFSQVPALNETSSGLNIKTDKYTVRITKDPLGLIILRKDQVIASLCDSAGLTYQDKDNTIRLTAIDTWKMEGKTLSVNCGTNLPGSQSNLNFVFESDRILLTWKQPEQQKIENMTISFSVSNGNHWYGGPVNSGHNWPLETSPNNFDPMISTSNQATPFWLTSVGVGYYLPTYKSMGFRLNNKMNNRFELFLKDSNLLELQLLIGNDVRDTYRIFAKTIGLPKTVPSKGFFTQPIFNTWIEYLSDIDQTKLLAYAHNIRSKKFPCEVLMIDAGWSADKSHFEFDKIKFPDPKAMIDELHRLNFKLLLWASPYVAFETNEYSFLNKSNYFIKDENGKKPGKITWWGGTDYEVDMSNPQAFEWFFNKLQDLQIRYGVDGFKLDGGDAEYIPCNYKTFANISPSHSTDMWAQLGTKFEYNEYRVSWMMQSSGLVQRLRDKHNNWSSLNGLGSLIPHGITCSLIGYSYFSPDMIGGGDSKDFRNPNYKGMGTELFVRWAQASALMPMMQFSYAPWNLDEKSSDICRRYADLHQQLGDYIYKLAKNTAKTGDPIIRPLFYNYPKDEKAFMVNDQFLLGNRFLVAPIVKQGAIARNVYLPKGLWKDFWSGTIYNGGIELKDFPAPIDVLPLFVKID